MGKLADALNFEKAYTIEGETFKVRRLSVEEILRCAIAGLRDAEGVDEEQAYEMAEDLISGEKIIFPKAGIMHVMAAASAELDLKDAEALAVLDESKARNVCRFVLGLPETAGDEPNEEQQTRKKKARRLTGWRLIRRCASILGSRSET